MGVKVLLKDAYLIGVEHGMYSYNITGKGL